MNLAVAVEHISARPAHSRSIMTRPPYLTNESELGELPLDGRGSVLLNSAGSLTARWSQKPLPIGQALNLTLRGDTKSFSVVVCYFALPKSVAQMGDVRSPVDTDGIDDDVSDEVTFDPHTLLRSELQDPADRSPESDLETRARILFNEPSTATAALALRTWWWLCRWRMSDPPAADAWRRTQLQKLSTVSPDPTPFDSHCVAFMQECTSLKLNVANDNEREGLRRWQQDLTNLRDSRIGVLVLYLLQRAAGVRCARLAQPDHLFHPKLYVVERRANPQDTYVFAGSANWSAAALSGAQNIEVATVHRCGGHLWSQAARDEVGSLGADLARTAKLLFEESPHFATWRDEDSDDARCCDFSQLEVALKVSPKPKTAPAGYGLAQARDENAPSDTPVRSRLADLAAALRRDIELALGMDREKLESLADLLKLVPAEVWGGKSPSAYQIDGAVRLLSLLGRQRGALLTDEPGLGKTMIAQLVLAALIHERLKERSAIWKEGEAPPMRVTILAPARVLGRSTSRQAQTAHGGDTQWFRYANEVRAAVDRLRANESLLAVDEAGLQIRPLTIDSLSRRLRDRKTQKTGQLQDNPLRATVVDDLHHLSCSEVVIIDEAHNLRNGGSYASRILRFCLAVPSPGEVGWRPTALSHQGVGQTAIKEASASHETAIWSARSGRKVLLLSATPFNNRIEDVITQVGHFATAMTDWPQPTEQIHRRVVDPPIQRNYWHPDPSPNTSAEGPAKRKTPPRRRGTAKADAGSPDARADFMTLLELAERHFKSGRALDEEQDTLLERQNEPKKKRSNKPSDGGPRYAWADTESTRDLSRAFGKIVEHFKEQVKSARTHIAANETVPPAELRNRVDQLLVSFVVQRSRRQVLELVRNEVEASGVQMFRAPQQLREPRAVVTADEERKNKLDSVEAMVIDALAEAVAAQEDGDVSPSHTETGSGKAAAKLTMRAYSLRYERGLARRSAEQTYGRDQRRRATTPEGKSDLAVAQARTASNFIGFQLVGLVKRLQSSHYAFVMTLARGLLRTCLYEVALAHEIATRFVTSLERTGGTHVSKKGVQGVQQTIGVATASHTRLDLARRICDVYGNAFETDPLDAFNPARADRARTSQKQLFSILGVDATELRKSRVPLRLLAGVESDDNAEPTNRHRLYAEVDEGLDELAVTSSSSPHTAKRGKKGGDSSESLNHRSESVSWVVALFEDLADPEESLILRDLRFAVGVLFGSRDSGEPGLLELVFGDLDIGSNRESVPAKKDSARVVTRPLYGVSTREAPASVDSLAVYAKWVHQALENDRRATSTIGWLLAQTAMRQAAERDPSLREAMPAGAKSLIFSEYADTVDYLRALLVWTHAICTARQQGHSQKLGPSRRQVGDARGHTIEILRRHAIDVVKALGPSSVGEDVGNGVAGSTSAGVAPAPIDPVQFEAMFGASSSDSAWVVEALAAIMRETAVLTSRERTGSRLGRSPVISPASGSEEDPTGIDAEEEAAVDDGDFESSDEADTLASTVESSSALDAFSPWYQIDVSATVDPATRSVHADRLETALRNPVHAMLATEVLAEGVNLQESGVVLHYDLPWNPTRLIQRNGRVDRRIDPRVEDAEARRKLVSDLLGPVPKGEELAAQFWAPRHVYHLTVPPVEPRFVDDEQVGGGKVSRQQIYANKVRQILFTKLSGIREIFGLAAWPVVFNQEDAKEALDGRLVYETPAFQRRESLLAHYAQLAPLESSGVVQGDVASRPPSQGSIVIRLDEQSFNRVCATIRPQTPVATAFKTSQAAAWLSFWSREVPTRIPVHSGIDLDTLARGDNNQNTPRGAIQLLTFLRQSERSDVTTVDEVLVRCWFQSRSDRTTQVRIATTDLSSADPQIQPDTEPADLNSPTSAAETALGILAHAVLLDARPPIAAAASAVRVSQIEFIPEGLPSDATSSVPQWVADCFKHASWSQLDARPISLLDIKPLPTQAKTAGRGFNILVLPQDPQSAWRTT